MPPRWRDNSSSSRRFLVREGQKATSYVSLTRLLWSKKTRRQDPTSRQLGFLGPRKREGEIRHLVNSTSWVQEDEKAWSGISSTRLPGSKETRRWDPVSFSSTRLLGSKKARRRDPASRQVDFLGPKRREGKIWHLVNSTSWVQEDEKARPGISSTRLLGSKKARRRDPAFHQLDFFGPRRRDPASCQLDIWGPRRREGEIRHLVNSTSWVQEDEKTRSGISSTRLPGSKKARRRDPASRQRDFLGPRRKGEFLDLVKLTSCAVG